LLSGTRSGSYTNTGLSNNTTYTYYLRHSGQTLDTATCSTSGGGVVPTCDSPIATTYHASSISTNSAVLNGYVEPYSEYTHYWFEYGTSSSNLNNSTSKQTTYSSINFNRSISGLSNNATYYFRAVAQSNCGISYGQILNFRTGSDYYYHEDSLTIQKWVRSVDRNTEWLDSVTVAPGELIAFYIRVKSDGYMDNVVVRDVLPSGLVYAYGLTIDDVASSGDIAQGINIGNVSKGQSRVVVFNARVAGEQQFGIGSTNIVNTAFASSGSKSVNDTAKVFVTRGVVAGVATHISTGLTDNKLIDFVILPLLATLLIFVLFRKHISILVEWLERKREDVLDSRARRKLERIRQSVRIS
ncbi:MAG: hypothetical protein PHV25_03100, partial [Candidatus Pacebacteria bacterium]|nr:hypothetical protein [Candidatus Paceibacterota bacterium]